MTDTEPLFCETLDDQQRLVIPYEIFGLQFMRVESAIFDFAAYLCADYSGGFWEMVSLSNGAFYMLPAGNDHYSVHCPNGFEGDLSADGFGVAVGLYSYSHLSFDGPPVLARACADQYHLLREVLSQHDEASSILAATD